MQKAKDLDSYHRQDEDFASPLVFDTTTRQFEKYKKQNLFEKMIVFLNKALPKRLLYTGKRMLGHWRLSKARRLGTFVFKPSHAGLPNILFYDLLGLSYGGTQKSLQILAKHLNKEQFNVFFMHGPGRVEERIQYMDSSGVKLVSFKYERAQESMPFYLQGMKPHFFDVIRENNIDLVVAAGSGYPEYPLANLLNLPIIHFNIFGSVNPQGNIVKHLCISHYLAARIKAILPGKDIETFYIQSESPDAGAAERGLALRRKLSIRDDALVFGRIGRPDDNIFDPIGIDAFRSIIKDYPDVHYIIMAPPPVLEKLLKDHPVPNVHLLPPSGSEDDVWAFHHAINALAHFRYDGETMGLNIAEAMLCGRPILTHKSRIWNAHLEYLKSDFSWVAEIDDVEGYADNMTNCIAEFKEGRLAQKGQKAKAVANKLFLINNNISSFEKVIEQVLYQTK